VLARELPNVNPGNVFAIESVDSLVDLISDDDDF